MSNFLVGLDINDVQVSTFSGNASTTAFTLPVAATTNGAAVYISGIRQVPTTDFSIASTTITFSTAPVTGSSNIMVVYTKPAILNTPADASVTSAKIGNDQVDSQHLVAGSVDLEHMSSQSVDEDNLHISNAGSNGNFLSKQSGDAGGLTWAASPAGGAWTLIATDVGDSSGNLEVTGLSATYDTYAIALSDVVGASDAQHGYFRLGDSSGYDSGASDYSFIAQGTIASSGTYTGDTANANQAQMKLTMVSAQSIGNATGEGIGGLFYLHTPSDGSTLPLLSGTVSYTGNGGVLGTVAFGGRRESSITVDRVTFLFQSGNVATGRMTVWGISHT